MNVKLKNILKVIVYTGLITASVIAIMQNFSRKKNKNQKEEMILIAKKIDADIKNLERKISPRYHKKNQEKYNKLWGGGYNCNN